MTKTRIKKVYILIVIFCLMLLWMGGYYILTHFGDYRIYDCNKLEKEMNKAYGEKYVEKIERIAMKDEYLSISVSRTSSIDGMKKAYDYVKEKLLNQNNQISKWNCDWKIYINTYEGNSGERIVIQNTFIDERYNSENGIHMLIQGDFSKEEYGDLTFEDIEYLYMYGSRIILPAKELYFAEHFPDLKYLSLNQRVLTDEELAYLKSVLPENCVIEDYVMEK